MRLPLPVAHHRPEDAVVPIELSALRTIEQAFALRILAGEWPDIVISDIETPGEDGYSLTAYTRSADRVRALAAGFQTHIRKPVEPAELVAAVKSLSRHRR